ncbi:hypothetical protein [Caballeronia concitans]|uniref:Uncharacterized protein n=1 Tax=Caballeronia concitans TaxID=1777133 RepID=A0A658QYC8_9BURK|nr:hypothetical protein [Caballeronia concitans]KIG11415.1 hypothetical protein BurMR1_1696 [Burkholderia sp. MR1]SAL32810.1 hypothetical protein AWB72_03000 [Caballeronia concitans]
MVSLQEELARLEQADRHIAEATVRIATHEALIGSGDLPDAEKRRAEDLLAAMQATLAQFLLHREAIVEVVGQLMKQSHEEKRE